MLSLPYLNLLNC